MGHTRDLWTKPDPDDPTSRVPNARWGKGKRWLSCWLDPDGEEITKAFSNRTAATKHRVKMEADVERGDYRDPKAKREKVDAIAQRWLRSRDVDPSTRAADASIYRVHVKPHFGTRVAAKVKPSEIQERLTEVASSRSRSTRDSVKRVLGGIFELAAEDGQLTDGNPVRSKIVRAPRNTTKAITEVWGDATAWAIIDAHPDWLRVLPELGVGTGLREGELYGLAVDDIDGDTLHVRRQIKRITGGPIFGLPKNDSERDVPLSAGTAKCVESHLSRVSPVAVTLPWERIDGPLVTHKLLMPHPVGFLTSQRMSPIWRASLDKAGIENTREYGRHAMRHYYASLQLAEGTTITALAAYLGHHNPAFTLKMYGKLQPDSHERARSAIDNRFYRPRDSPDGI